MIKSINEISLRGVVTSVRTSHEENTDVKEFSLYVDTEYRDKNAEFLCTERTWFNVIAYSNNTDLKDFDKIAEGCILSLVGRVRTKMYTVTEYHDTTVTQVLVKHSTVCEESPSELHAIQIRVSD